MFRFHPLTVVALSLICLHGRKLWAPDPGEARTALVIGVSNYADRYFSKLEAPEADARVMAERLKALGFEVTVLRNASRREMLDATDAFGEALARRRGVGLFYFSGRGSMKPDEAGPNYLIPAGTRITSREDLPQGAFNAQRVANRMKDAGNRLNLIFLDACRDNALPSKNKSATGGLAAMHGASGRMFFFATQPSQIAIEDRENCRSLFTAALLKHMGTPGLSFMDMMADVTAETEQLSQQDGATFKQSPFMSGTLSGRFAFVPGQTPGRPATRAAPVVLPRPAERGVSASDLLFYKSIAGTREPSKTAYGTGGDGAFEVEISQTAKTLKLSGEGSWDEWGGGPDWGLSVKFKAQTATYPLKPIIVPQKAPADDYQETTVATIRVEGTLTVTFSEALAPGNNPDAVFKGTSSNHDLRVGILVLLIFGDARVSFAAVSLIGSQPVCRSYWF